MESPTLSDLKVLDLGEFVSGPYGTKLLADLGAEVLKVENPRGGDSARRWGPFPDGIPHPEKSGLFLYLNTNKKGITLDWRTDSGFRLLQQLARRADILVENLGPGVLDYEAVKAVNPSIIVISISCFGQEGPYRDFKGSDIVTQALGGVMNLTGLPDREPLKIPGPQAEYLAGLNAVVAVMAALYSRKESGQGQWIEVTAIECLASILEGALTSFAYDSSLRRRDGPRHPTAYPSTILPCRDGYVHVDASGDWETFARFMGMPELLRFKPEELRERADELDSLLLPRLAEKSRAGWFHEAQLWRLPFAMVMGINELPSDPQFQARRFFIEIDHPATGPLIYPGTPFKRSRTQQQSRRAPLLGEHNTEIYGGVLGYTAQELARLRGMGVI